MLLGVKFSLSYLGAAGRRHTLRASFPPWLSTIPEAAVVNSKTRLNESSPRRLPFKFNSQPLISPGYYFIDHPLHARRWPLKVQ